jgi:REP element-mobilizing transposase RayT
MPSTLLHHRRSIRLATYDHRERGAYFVTICTHQRELIFGNPRVARELELAWRSIGRYARARPDYFVVMPNHIHGIIWLTGAAPAGAQHTPKSGRPLATMDALECGATSGNTRAAPLRRPDPLDGPGRGSLAAIVRGFKSNTTKRVNELRNTPGAPVWQRNYNERIIRDDRELEAVREYIRNNPRKWADDPNNPANRV